MIKCHLCGRIVYNNIQIQDHNNTCFNSLLVKTPPPKKLY